MVFQADGTLATMVGHPLGLVVLVVGSLAERTGEAWVFLCYGKLPQNDIGNCSAYKCGYRQGIHFFLVLDGDFSPLPFLPQ